MRNDVRIKPITVLAIVRRPREILEQSTGSGLYAVMRRNWFGVRHYHLYQRSPRDELHMLNDHVPRHMIKLRK